MDTRMLYIHALSPIHVGVGQGAGIIDLPVIRETVTGWPYLPGSSVKGVLRDACDPTGASGPEIVVTFGPKTDNASDHAGGIIVADLRLLFLPVRSYAGGFAWVTSPLAMSRWLRDGGRGATELPKAARQVSDGRIVLSGDASTHAIGAGGGKVRLEDLELNIVDHQDNSVRQLMDELAKACFADQFWQAFFTAHAGVVSDTTFSFLTRTATEITARNRIDPDRKIVAEGALWLEEAVPAEAIFAGPMVLTDQGIKRFRKTIDANAGDDALARVVAGGIANPVQIGGNASVGRGIALARLDPPVSTPAQAATGPGGGR